MGGRAGAPVRQAQVAAPSQGGAHVLRTGESGPDEATAQELHSPQGECFQVPLTRWKFSGRLVVRNRLPTASQIKIQT